MQKSKRMLTDLSEHSETIRVQSRARILLRQKSRCEKIREKNAIYPQSTPQKIVFITNRYGNGFRKEKLSQFEYPSHIPVQGMLAQINQVCYHQWKNFHQKLQKKPLTKLEIAILVDFCLALLLFIIYMCLIRKGIASGFLPSNYLFCVAVILLLVLALLICCSHHQELHPDKEIVAKIEETLIVLNKKEEEQFPGMTRFKWTCHSQCLWIAISF